MKLLSLAIVGRTNVGKSTLFNCLTQSRQALVVDRPGVTRDRLYGEGQFEDVKLRIIDTCGVDGEQAHNLVDVMDKQLTQAIEEADAVLFVVDGKAGLLSEDRDFAERLRKQSKPVYVVVNKTDGCDLQTACADFYQLGFEHVLPISAAHKRGLQSMLSQIHFEKAQSSVPEEAPESGLKIAILGRPNVGKSTLTNRMLQDERVVVYDMPGTTRDSIYIPFTRHNKSYTLIDTAGIRRKKKVYDVVEKFSIIKAMEAIKKSDSVILVLNARENVYDQDLNILRYVLQTGRALVIAINKWDGLSADEKEAFKKKLQQKIQFAPKVRIHTISALHGTGVGDLFELLENAHASASQAISTNRLTQILEGLTGAHAPSMHQGRRIRLKLAQKVGDNPLHIMIHGNQTQGLSDHYVKYLKKGFAKALALEGALLKLSFKTSDNPYKGKRNVLTERQRNRKKRLLRHVKRAKKK